MIGAYAGYSGKFGARRKFRSLTKNDGARRKLAEIIEPERAPNSAYEGYLETEYDLEPNYSHSEIAEALAAFGKIQKHGEPMKILIADVSHYNHPVDYKALKAGGFAALIAKCGGSLTEDDLYSVHAAGARSAGLSFGAYYWLDPIYDYIRQGDHCVTLADREKADFIMADNEQWWASWSKWTAALLRKIPWSDVPVIPSKQINAAAYGFLKYLKANQPRRLLNYTGIGFVNDYCREMASWINEFDLMIAQYHPTGPGQGDLKRKKITFEQLHADYLPKDKPYLPVGWNDAILWQFTGDRLTFPGILDTLDISLWMSKNETPESWIGHQAPEPQPEPWVTRHLKPGVIGLNVRDQPVYPDGRIVRVLTPSDTILVEPDKVYNTVWVKLYNEQAFIHSGYIV
jgi:GH25 family lysozyme M1 (1,4-beta-N-acetylmuramidase)